MSDKEKLDRPRSRRPSYLSGPVGSARPVPASAQPEAGPARKPAEQAGQDKPDVKLYSWSVWLLPRRPKVSAGVIVALLGCIGLAYWAMPQILFVGIITLILINRLAPYLFPLKYSLTEKTAGYSTFLARDVREWGRIFTYHQYPDGILLANDVRSIRGRMREGMFLYFEPNGANKDEVLKIVQAKLKPPTEALTPKEGDQQPYKGGIGSAFRRVRKVRGKE